MAEEKSRAEQSREEKRREERRKEGRKDAGVSAFWQTNASIPGGSSTESVSVSLFLFRSSPTPPCVSRVAAALPISLSPPRARPSPHHSPWAATRASPPLSPRPALFLPPRTAAHRLLPPPPFPELSLPRVASSRPSRRYYALAPARQRQITLHFQNPKELQRPTPLPTPALCSHHLRPRSSSTSFHGTCLLRRPTILTPLSSSLPRPTPPPLPPTSETLRYVGHQMGAQPLRTPGERLVQERRAGSFNSLPTSARSDLPASCSRRLPSNVHVVYG